MHRSVDDGNSYNYIRVVIGCTLGQPIVVGTTDNSKFSYNIQGIFTELYFGHNMRAHTHTNTNKQTHTRTHVCMDGADARAFSCTYTDRKTNTHTYMHRHDLDKYTIIAIQGEKPLRMQGLSCEGHATGGRKHADVTGNA